MRKIGFSTIILTACILASCNSANVIVPSNEFTTYNVATSGGITAIEVSNAITVEYVQSANNSVVVTCPDNMKDAISVAVSDGRLIAGLKQGRNISGKCNVTVLVEAPAVSSIEAASAAVVTAGKPIALAGIMEIDAASAARVELAGLSCGALDVECAVSAKVAVGSIDCRKVTVEAASASTVVLEGSADTALYEASSAASVDARYLSVKQLRKAEASSAASISYKADTVEIVKNNSGGKVNRR